MAQLFKTYSRILILTSEPLSPKVMHNAYGNKN